MKKIAIVAAVAALCSFGASAQNVGSFYGEAAYSTVTLKDMSSDNLGTFKPTAARLTVGNVLVNNLAVEGFILQGLSSDSANFGSANIDIALKTSYGVALRPFINLTDSVELYGRLGSVRTKGEGTASFNGQVIESSTTTSTRTLYGIGLAYKLTNNAKLVADYTKLSTKDETKSSVVSVGVRFGF